MRTFGIVLAIALAGCSASSDENWIPDDETALAISEVADAFDYSQAIQTSPARPDPIMKDHWEGDSPDVDPAMQADMLRRALDRAMAESCLLEREAAVALCVRKNQHPPRPFVQAACEGSAAKCAEDGP